MTVLREDIDVSTAIQGESEAVVLVRSAWDSAVWDTVRGEIEARIAAGQTPVIASHLQRLGLYDVVELLARYPESYGSD
jgi:hypothetical protein